MAPGRSAPTVRKQFHRVRERLPNFAPGGRFTAAASAGGASRREPIAVDRLGPPARRAGSRRSMLRGSADGVRRQRSLAVSRFAVAGCQKVARIGPISACSRYSRRCPAYGSGRLRTTWDLRQRFCEQLSVWKIVTSPNRECPGQRLFSRRAWDSNPQALAGNGFQVMSPPSWLFPSDPNCTFLSGHSGRLLPDWPGLFMAAPISS